MSASKVRAGQAFVEIGADPRKLFASLGKINQRIGKLGQSMVSMGSRMTAIGAAVAAPIALATRQFSVFDDAIRATAAVSQATGAALQSMNDRARELGATTSFTAVQVAGLMTALGRAGFKPDEINAMTGAVLNLARATGTDASLSAKIMSETLRQFSLDAGNATRVADVLTQTANSTNNTVEGLGEALSYAGLNAAQAGMSIEETAALLGALGNVGIQGSNAGTVLRRLVTISGAEAEKLGQIFDISALNAQGGVRKLVDVFDDIAKATNDLPSGERLKKFNDAFGLLGITGAQALGGAVGDIRALQKSLLDVDGVSAKTAKEMDAGLGGAIRILLSAVEGTALAIGDALAPSMQKLAEIVTNVAGGLTEFVKKNQELVVSAVKGVAIFIATGAALIAVGVALKVASAGVGVLLALMNPIGIIAVALGAMVGSTLAFSGALGDMAAVAKTAFGGIYEAIADGDLSGAMDILWAGLYAGWLRGVEAIMGAVDPWISLFQNTFTYLGTAIASTWDGMWTGVSNSFNTFGAYLQGAFDNVINGVLAAWDTLEAGIRKSWNYVQSFFKKGFNLKEENEKVDNQMDARRRKRELERPGIEGRTKKADEENRQATKESDQRRKAMDDAADETAAGREDENRRRADARRAATQAAEQNVATKSGAARAKRTFNAQFAELLKNIESASSISQLQDLYGEFDALSANGRLTTAQQATIEAALEDAQERVSRASSTMGGSANRVDPKDVGNAAADATASQAEVAGTFSALAVGGMGLGQSLQQKQVDLLGKIEANTRENEGGFVND